MLYELTEIEFKAVREFFNQDKKLSKIFARATKGWAV
jgi:hypothetical protein